MIETSLKTVRSPFECFKLILLLAIIVFDHKLSRLLRAYSCPERKEMMNNTYAIHGWIQHKLGFRNRRTDRGHRLQNHLPVLKKRSTV